MRSQKIAPVKSRNKSTSRRASSKVSFLKEKNKDEIKSRVISAAATNDAKESNFPVQARHDSFMPFDLQKRPVAGKEVETVLPKLQMAKKVRTAQKYREKMQTIMARVKCALLWVGPPGELEKNESHIAAPETKDSSVEKSSSSGETPRAQWSRPDSSAVVNVAHTPIYSESRKRTLTESGTAEKMLGKLLQKQKAYKAIENLKQSCYEKHSIMVDMETWLSSTSQQMLDDMVEEDDLSSGSKEEILTHIYERSLQKLQYIEELIFRLDELGKKLVKQTWRLQQTQTENKKETDTAYDSDYYDSATNKTKLLLQQATKFAPNMKEKLLFQKGLKNFCDNEKKRAKKIKQMSEELLQLNDEMTKLNTINYKHVQQIDILTDKLRQAEARLLSTENDSSKIEEVTEKYDKQVETLQKKIEELTVGLEQGVQKYEEEMVALELRLQQQEQHYQEELSEIQSKLHTESRTDRSVIQHYQQQIQDLQVERKEDKSRIARLEENISSKPRNNEEVYQKMAGLEQEVVQKQTKIDELQQTLEENQKKIDSISSSVVSENAQSMHGKKSDSIFQKKKTVKTSQLSGREKMKNGSKVKPDSYEVSDSLIGTDYRSIHEWAIKLKDAERKQQALLQKVQKQKLQLSRVNAMLKVENPAKETSATRSEDISAIRKSDDTTVLLELNMKQVSQLINTVLHNINSKLTKEKMKCDTSKLDHMRQLWLESEKKLNKQRDDNASKYNTLMSKYRQVWQMYKEAQNQRKEEEKFASFQLQEKEKLLESVNRDKAALEKKVELTSVLIGRMQLEIRMEKEERKRVLSANEKSIFANAKHPPSAELKDLCVGNVVSDQKKEESTTKLRGLFGRYIFYRNMKKRLEYLQKKLKQNQIRNSRKMQAFLLKLAYTTWTFEASGQPKESNATLSQQPNIYKSLRDKSTENMNNEVRRSRRQGEESTFRQKQNNEEYEKREEPMSAVHGRHYVTSDHDSLWQPAVSRESVDDAPAVQCRMEELEKAKSLALQRKEVRVGRVPYPVSHAEACDLDEAIVEKCIHILKGTTD